MHDHLVRLLLLVVDKSRFVARGPGDASRLHGAHPGEAARDFLGGVFRLQYAENPGAFLSLGASLSPGQRAAAFGLGVALVLLAVFVTFLLWNDLDRLGAWGLSLVLGGGVSNLADRFFREGRVIDFLNVGVGGLRTGIFNVADIAVMVGVALLAWSARRRKLGPSAAT